MFTLVARERQTHVIFFVVKLNKTILLSYYEGFAKSTWATVWLYDFQVYASVTDSISLKG